MAAITPQDLYAQLSAEKFYLVDVRQPEEYKEAHIKGSYLFPLADFLDKPEAVPLEGHKIIFVCRSGSRSGRATDYFLSKFPNAKAYNLTGGILAWKAAGLPLEQ